MLYGFESLKTDSLKEALSLLKKKRKIKVLAGGTDLLVKMKSEDLDVNYLLDISGIRELKGIKVLKNSIKIGSLTRISELASHPVIAERFTALYEGIRGLGSLQTRNMATIGGNIINGSPAGDSLPALYLFGATLELESIDGKRKVKIDEFIKGPGKTTIKKGEILTYIHLKFPDGVSAYGRSVGRQAVAISKVSAAVLLKSKKGSVEQLEIALGAVGPTIVKVRGTDKLKGEKIDDKFNDTILSLVKKSATPIDDIRSTKEYRTHVIGVLVKRLIERLS